MEFISFEIVNFKGIESAKIDLIPRGARVYTLIGLNESGKTTVLEAISKFRPDQDKTEALYGVVNTGSDQARYIPKHLKSNFTGKSSISVSASISNEDISIISRKLEEKFSAKLDNNSFPREIKIERSFRYENSDYKSSLNTWWLEFSVKKKGDRKFKKITHPDEMWGFVVSELNTLMPKVVYFPTFLFEFPEKINLNPKGAESPVNSLYRKIIDDVASQLKNPLDVKTHIVDRIVGEDSTIDKAVNFVWGGNKQEQVNATLAQISAHITNTVFEEWAKVFGGNFRGREIVLLPGVDTDKDGNRFVFLQFTLREGASTYSITERSLGFRWFFSFLLFTLYRATSKGRGATLFLLDEPASNLHSKAQTQLMESFPKISEGKNSIIYSTHSHYLVNPNWLEQAFIVANSAIDYEDATGESSSFVRDDPTRISINRYRQFVGQNPDKITYFQPVLDKLNYAPSKLDIGKDSVLVEGKGDYYILEYIRKVVLKKYQEFSIVPTRGAAGMNELIGLFLGWGIKFCICLDGDKAGLQAKAEYIQDWGLNNSLVFTYSEAVRIEGNFRVENLLKDEDLAKIKEYFSIKKAPDKGQIRLFFSEHLATEEKVELSSECLERAEAILRAMSLAVASPHPSSTLR